MKKDTDKTFSDEQVADLEVMIEDRAEEIVKEKLKDYNLQVDDVELNSDPLYRKDAKNFKKFLNIWKNNGRIDSAGRRISFEEMARLDMKATRVMRDNFSSDQPLLTQRVVTVVAQEAIEPNLVLTPLLQRLNMPKVIQTVFPAWGGMVAGKVGEGEEYPEMSLELAGRVSATTGKYGVAVKMTDEMIENSQFDVMSIHLRAAGRAMARLKEQLVADLITTDVPSSSVIFDNQSTSVRSSTGRDASGAYNGTLTLDDLFHAYAVMVDRGFIPNTLIMHPFAWQIFAQEGIARAFGFINGINPLMWQTAQGRPGNAPSFNAGGLLGNTSYVSQPQQLASTFTNVPSIFPTNFSIIVSPFMPFSASTERTDIVLCDRSELGVMVVAEELMTEEWDDPARDIRKVKFRERYGLASSNDGKGIGLLKNIKIARSFDFADKISANITLQTGLNSGALSNDPNFSGFAG